MEDAVPVVTNGMVMIVPGWRDSKRQAQRRRLDAIAVECRQGSFTHIGEAETLSSELGINDVELNRMLGIPDAGNA